MKPAEAYILDLKEPFQGIALQIKDCIEFTMPNVELKFKLNIPFFYYKEKMFCYLNFSKQKKYLDLCFYSQDKLLPFDAFLNTEKRKVVKFLRIHKYLNAIKSASYSISTEKVFLISPITNVLCVLPMFSKDVSLETKNCL